MIGNTKNSEEVKRKKESRLGYLRRRIEQNGKSMNRNFLLNIDRRGLEEHTKDEIINYFLVIKRQYIISRNHMQNLYLKERNMIWRIRKITKELDYMASYPYSQSYGGKMRKTRWKKEVDNEIS